MKRRVFIAGAAAGSFLGGCASSRFQSYDGPEVTWIVVNKSAGKMYLLNNEQVLKDYKIDLGFAPEGDKQFEGDGKTPEGTYYIDRRNPNSRFHLSLGISYPNARDVAEARAMGKSPGGDIFVHGQENKLKPRTGENWTFGCIAVKNKHIEEIYAMVKNGTPITINP